MNLIVAVDINWAIGNNGELLEVLSGDMKHFKSTTTGKTIVLGRETLKTFPGGNPLKNRTNIILTRARDFNPPNGIIVNSIDELLEKLKDFNSEEIYVVGGASVYEQLLPHVSTAYITKFHNEHTADKYLTNLDLSPEWELAETSEVYKEKDVKYTFNVYKRTK
jgi:dihydrofolate reductase